MANHVQQILDGITNDDAEGFLGAGELLRAHTIGLEGTSVLEPYAANYAASPLNDEDVVALKDALLKYLLEGCIPNAASAAHGLTQLGDRSLIPTFTRILNERLSDFSRQGYAIGQLLLALDRCGENATTGNSYSSDAFDQNMKDAREYLLAKGFEGQW